MRKCVNKPMYRFVVYFICMLFFISGCGSKYGPQTTVVNHYPECYSPISQLREEQSKFVKTVAVGAVAGALIGAAIGAAVGGGRGALAGSAIGAVAGGGISAAMTKYKQIQDDKERRSYLSQDIASNAATLDHVGLAAATATKCYQDQFNMLQSELDQGTISKELYQSKALEIISGLNEIATITNSINTEAESRMKEYESAMSAEAKKDNATLPAAKSLLKGQDTTPPSEPEKTEPSKPTTAPKSKPNASKGKKGKKSKEDVENDLSAAEARMAMEKRQAKDNQQVAAGLSESSALPGVVSGDRSSTLSTAVGTANVDNSSLPGVVAQRDNYFTMSEKLKIAEKDALTAKASCIAKASASGVQIPKSLMPEKEA